MKRLIVSALFCVYSFFSFSQDKEMNHYSTMSTPTEHHLEAKAGELYGEFCGNTLEVPGNSGNSNTGIMFDIEPTTNFFISGFSVRLYTNYSGYISIYRRSGTHVGFENNSLNWFLVDSVLVSDDGSGGYTYIPIESGPAMFTGQPNAFYIKGQQNSSVIYSDGTAVGTTIVSNSDMIVKEGTGIAGTFGNVFSPRKFEGEVHYCKNSTVVCDTAVTTFNNENGNRGLFFDVSAGNQEITVNKVYQDLVGTSGRKFNVQVYSRTGTHVGFEGSLVGWTLLSDVQLVSPLPNIAAVVAQGLNLVIPANSTVGFYIQTDPVVSLSYSNSTNSVGTPFYTDGNITIHTGLGADGDFAGTTYAQRTFNGAFDYCADDLSIEDHELFYLNIWPNPATDEIFVNSQSKNVSSVKLYNSLGQEMEVDAEKMTDGGFQIDVQSLSHGTYVVHAIIDQKLSTQKFVKL